MHILIIGNSDTNRAAVIDLIIAQLASKPKLYGYRSVKEPEDEGGRAPIYIYPVNGERIQTRDNLLGWCQMRRSVVCPGAFERNVYLIEDTKPDGLLVMDEIGPMESKSPCFCAAVFAALDGDTPILANVRDNDTPFLAAVRSHPKAQCFFLTKENGSRLFLDVLNCLNAQGIQ